VSDFVLDNSVSMRWLMPSLKLEDQQYADTVLKSMADFTAIVPNLWRLEVANVLLAAEKRQQLDVKASELFVRQLQQLSIFSDSQTANRVFSDTLLLARQHQLSSYNAAYLELALREGLPIASLDKDLLQAASSVGVPLYLC
jgi:predicted nucleic acid-binding protein